MLLAKESLMEPLNMHELQANGASNPSEELRMELFEKVNALGIGAQGLGGLTTVLDVKVKDYPTHAANKTRGNYSQLQCHAACAFYAGWFGASPIHSAGPVRVAGY